MDFDTWWRVTGQLDEGGKDDWRECWDAAIAAERAWFVQALREWDQTSDVELLLGVRLEELEIKKANAQKRQK